SPSASTRSRRWSSSASVMSGLVTMIMAPSPWWRPQKKNAAPGFTEGRGCWQRAGFFLDLRARVLQLPALGPVAKPEVREEGGALRVHGLELFMVRGACQAPARARARARAGERIPRPVPVPVNVPAAPAPVPEQGRAGNGSGSVNVHGNGNETTANAPTRSLPAVPPPGWRGRGGAASRAEGKEGGAAPAHARSSKGKGVGRKGLPHPHPQFKGAGGSPGAPAFCHRHPAPVDCRPTPNSDPQSRTRMARPAPRVLRTADEIHALRDRATSLRRHIVRMLATAGSGHPGGSLSAVEIVTALYFGGIMRYDPQRPDWPERDRFILSKGHGVPVQYAAMAEAGFFPVSEL